MSIVTLELDKDVIALLEAQQHQRTSEAAQELIIFRIVPPRCAIEREGSAIA
jgi:hypothetical protein